MPGSLSIQKGPRLQLVSKELRAASPNSRQDPFTLAWRHQAVASFGADVVLMWK